MTHSRSQYVHWIDLYDAQDNRIDPTDPNAAPYSPTYTCGRCHDYAAIAQGHHFNAILGGAAGRAGEPWIWTDPRTGTQLPLSYRGWEGTYDPRQLGISAWDFLLKFGHHLPGGGPGQGMIEVPADVSARDTDAEDEASEDETGGQAVREMPAAPVDNGRWKLSGHLAVDCMLCHGNDGAYNREVWWDQISKQNFAWASAAALGIADVEGDVSRLEDEPPAPADGATEEGEQSAAAQPRTDLPKTTYRPVRISAEKKIFFDIVHKPSENVCYYCHTARPAGESALPDWTLDEDVHIRAGMTCADCHRNGVDHLIVRGFEGETHPSGENITTLSCRGCHMGESGGRMGAPKPLHKGLPPLHLERLSCTACHSGPGPADQAMLVQTAMAHELGLPTHSLDASTNPEMVAPVMLRSGEEGAKVLYPHRMVWPAFWGVMQNDQITPMHPEVSYELIRKTIRVRRNQTFTEVLGKASLTEEDRVAALGEEDAKRPDNELSEQARTKLAQAELAKSAEAFRAGLQEGLMDIKAGENLVKAIEDAEKDEDENLVAALRQVQSALAGGAQAVYVAGGRVYRLAADDQVEMVVSPAAEPYAWKLAHDVRPARWSTGANNGCFDCHELGAPIFYGTVTAMGPNVDEQPPTYTMLELAGYDQTQIDAWNQSFQGRTAFKWFGFVSASLVALVLLAFLLMGVNGVVGLFRRG